MSFFANLQQSNVRIWFLLNILRTNRRNETKFCIHIIIDKICIGIVNCHVSQICNCDTALDLIERTTDPFTECFSLYDKKKSTTFIRSLSDRGIPSILPIYRNVSNTNKKSTSVWVLMVHETYQPLNIQEYSIISYKTIQFYGFLKAR